MKKSLILLLLAASVSAVSAASLKVNLGSASSGDDWIGVATTKNAPTGGQANAYKSITSLSKDGGASSSSLVLGNLGGSDVTLSMSYKSTASASAGYLDGTNNSSPLNPVFSESMAKSSITDRCNGVKGREVGLQFTLGGLAANTTYYLYVLGNSGLSTNKTSMTLSGGVTDITGNLMDGYEGAGSVSGSTFQGAAGFVGGVGMEWAFTTNDSGQVTLTYERAMAGTNDVVSADIALNGFILATAPIPEPVTASLGLMGLACLMMRRRRIQG